MKMPVKVEIVGRKVPQSVFDDVFNYLMLVDERFSFFKKSSEVTLYNEGKITEDNISEDLREILKLSEEFKNKTDGFFNVYNNGKLNPSGLVKGWAINNAAKIIRQYGYKNFYVEIAGDMEISGLNADDKEWVIGIRNPFNKSENIKILNLSDVGIATSGTYEKGNHIYNPKNKKEVTEIVSLTVIGPNVYEADCFATACFAMGKNGINFIESLPGFEGYMVDQNELATYTSGFEKYVKNN